MTDSQTILGFDYGGVRIGVARVDTFVKLPEPLGIIATDDWQGLQELVDEHKPAFLVVGLPRSLDGTQNAQAAICKQFARDLTDKTGLPTIMQDESLTTVMASDARGSKGQSNLDAQAACIILEDYLREHV